MPNAFMQEAISRAVENVRSGKGGPFAAVVVKEGRIIATGTNCVTSTNDPTAHAEMTAIREACRGLSTFQLAGCEIYTL
jgi:tRNA(Arg) A34 adenosine deaminase TadA